MENALLYLVHLVDRNAITKREFQERSDKKFMP